MTSSSIKLNSSGRCSHFSRDTAESGTEITWVTYVSPRQSKHKREYIKACARIHKSVFMSITPSSLNPGGSKSKRSPSFGLPVPSMHALFSEWPGYCQCGGFQMNYVPLRYEIVLWER